jgi:hypothetical protein
MRLWTQSVAEEFGRLQRLWCRLDEREQEGKVLEASDLQRQS